MKKNASKLYLILLLFLIFITFKSTQNVLAVDYYYSGEGLYFTFSNGVQSFSGMEIPSFYDHIYIVDDNTPNPEKFNCHFYTFFVSVPERMNNISIPGYYWFESNVELFFSSNRYIEVNNRYDAEIIAYYDANGNLKHTGRVIEAFEGTPISETNDSNLVKVISKWDDGYIVTHRGDCCIHTGYPNINTGYIKYYSLNHTHNYQYSYDNDSHVKYCNLAYCYYSQSSDHSLIYTQNGLNHSKDCSICQYHQIEEHNYIYSRYDEIYHNKSCSLCNYNIRERHNWTSINDLLFLCDDCGLRARFIPVIHNGFNPITINNNFPMILYNNNYYYVILVD